MGRTASGIDVGSATATYLRGEVKGNTFVVSDFHIAPNEGGTIASGWEVLRDVAKPGLSRIGVSGREVNLRYSRVPRLPDWQLRKLMRFETQEIGDQSDASVASDFNVLPEMPEIEGEDVVLLSLTRESLLEEHAAGLASLGGKLDAFTPSTIALYNAFLHYGVVMEDTVLVADIGHDNTDVILVRGTDLVFARNLSGGARLFDQALAERFGITPERAGRFKMEQGSLDPNGSFTDPNREKASRAMAAPAGQLLSLVQSVVLFAKSQVKLSTLRLDRVFICGGGAALEGLPEYLAQGLSVPVEVFDPFVVVDTSKLDAHSAELLEDHKLEAVVALGLATTGSDPNAYNIEILPEKVRKRREFLGGQAFLIAAAVLALLFLGARAWKERSDLARLDKEASALGLQLKKAERHHGQTSALLEENAALASFTDELFALAGAGEQMVRAMSVLERDLPADFWVESMTMSERTDPDLDVPREEQRPILTIKGRAREGTETPTLLFEGFVESVRQRMPRARLKDRMGDSSFQLDLTNLAEASAPVDGDGAAAGEANGEAKGGAR